MFDRQETLCVTKMMIDIVSEIDQNSLLQIYSSFQIVSNLYPKKGTWSTIMIIDFQGSPTLHISRRNQFLKLDTYRDTAWRRRAYMVLEPQASYT